MNWPPTQTPSSGFSTGQFPPKAFPNATPVPQYPLQRFPYQNIAPLAGNVQSQVSSFNNYYKNQGVPTGLLLQQPPNTGLSPRFGGRRRRGRRSLRQKSRRKGKRNTRRNRY